MVNNPPVLIPDQFLNHSIIKPPIGSITHNSPGFVTKVLNNLFVLRTESLSYPFIPITEADKKNDIICHSID